MNNTVPRLAGFIGLRLVSLIAVAALAACAGSDETSEDEESAAVTDPSSNAATLYQGRERFDQPPLPESETTGVDDNHNHIRDDVERYIDKTYGDKPKEWLSQRQLARAYQHMLANADDEMRTLNAIDELFAANACAGALIDDDIKIRDELKARIVDTELRLHAFISAHRHAGGQFFKPPSDSVIQCQFDVEGL